MKIKIEERIKQIENEIEDKVAEDFYKEIIEALKYIGGDDMALSGS